MTIHSKLAMNTFSTWTFSQSAQGGMVIQKLVTDNVASSQYFDMVGVFLLGD